MIFNEVYSSYYRVTAEILREAARGKLTERKLYAMVREQAFGESVLTLPEDLRSGRWHLLNRDFATPLREVPDPPLTILEKRWLRTLLADPRIRLFSPDITGLEDAEPLFLPEDIVYYDRYADGDNFEDPGYIANFRTVLEAIRNGVNLEVSYESRHHETGTLFVTPFYLEYSEKDDRFRLVGSGHKRRLTLNMAQIRSCRILTDRNPAPFRESVRKSVTFELQDRRNALERVLLHFSHLEKETRRTDDINYVVTLKYDQEDETEILIRILSFGPFIRVTEPESFIELIRERLRKQMALSNAWREVAEQSGNKGEKQGS